MDFQATFSNQLGQAKTLDIKDGFNLQDAYNVVANDDFAPTQITLEPINMNSSDSNVEPDKQVETAYDLGRYSINDIIDKHKISSDELAVLLEEGTNHELEHTSSYLIAMKIAQDHLYEDLRYYSKLKEVMLARGAAIESAKFKNGELENQKIIDVAKSVVLELGEIYSENDYLGKCKEISEEISNRLKNLNINAIPMRIIEGEDTKYNSLVFNHAYTFLPDKNYIVDTQLWQLERNIDDLSQRKVLFSFDEYNKIVKLYDVEPIDNWEERFRQGGLIAPNGKSSNLTAEQYKMVRTPEFKAWFGDWENDPENASKVVDENGEPLVVYHGTKYSQEFYEFDLDAIPDENVKAFFFSKGYEHGERYTFSTGSVKPFFLKAKKLFDPKSLSMSESKKIRSIFNESVVQDFIEYNYLDGLDEWKSKYDSNMSDEDFLFYILTKTDSSWGVVELQVMQDYLKSNNYDGFITYEQVTNQSTPNLNYAIFEPNQIKLADGTNTTFDGKNPDIRFDKGGYVSEQVLIENKIDKIDDIYVFSENDEPVKSLGEFTLQGFGKYMMKDLAGELYSDYKIRLRSDFAIMLGNDVIKPSIKVAQMKGDRIEILAIIYNAMVSEEQAVSYVYNADGEVVGKFTDEDFAEDMVNNNDGYYSEVRVEELETPETILAMQFDFNKHEMTFISTLLEKQSTHKFKYGGKL